MQTATYVCLQNCTCPADGDSCSLSQDCSIKVDIDQGGSSNHAARSFFGWVFALAMGGVAVLGYIHFMGVPAWLPIRMHGFGGLYHELSDVEGI